MNGSAKNAASRSTLVVTNLIKLAGLVFGLRQGLMAHPDARILALATVWVAGAQVGENIAVAIFDRVFAPPPPPPTEDLRSRAKRRK